MEQSVCCFGNKTSLWPKNKKYKHILQYTDYMVTFYIVHLIVRNGSFVINLLHSSFALFLIHA